MLQMPMEISTCDLDASMEADPVWEKAVELSAFDVAKISVSTDRASFLADVKAHVSPAEKVVCIIDCRTSKAKVFMDLLEFYEKDRDGTALECTSPFRGLIFSFGPLPVQELDGIIQDTNSKLCVPVGKRLDLVPMLQQKMKFKSLTPYVVQCAAGVSQTTRVPPTYVVRSDGASFKSQKVPANCVINSVMAESFERVRQGLKFVRAIKSSITKSCLLQAALHRPQVQAPLAASGRRGRR